MILEIALLPVRPGQSAAFEAAFAQAVPLIAGQPGYVRHSLTRSLDQADRYLLQVYWQRLEDHTEGFRRSAEYQDWKRLLHHFYEPFPAVEYFEVP